MAVRCRQRFHFLDGSARDSGRVLNGTTTARDDYGNSAPGPAPAALTRGFPLNSVGFSASQVCASRLGGRRAAAAIADDQFPDLRRVGSQAICGRRRISSSYEKVITAASLQRRRQRRLAARFARSERRKAVSDAFASCSKAPSAPGAGLFESEPRTFASAGPAAGLFESALALALAPAGRPWAVLSRFRSGKGMRSDSRSR
jgi:hypothetical protein